MFDNISVYYINISRPKKSSFNFPSFIYLFSQIFSCFSHFFNLESGVLGLLEGLADGTDGVASVRVPRHVLEHRLHTDLEPGTPVAKHVGKMAFQTVIGTGLDSYS